MKIELDRSEQGSRTEPVYLSLGSNMGCREENLRNALVALDREDVRIVVISSIYETEPISEIEQNYFLNVCCQARTDCTPEQLLARCLMIEANLGRQRSERNGPRIIDIDLLFFGNRILRTYQLTLPHPGIITRRFVLAPLAEIAPEFLHPEIHQPISRLLEDCQDSSQVMKLHPYSILEDVPLLHSAKEPLA